MLEAIRVVGQTLGYVMTIVAFVLMILRPLGHVREGQRCLLRHNMLHIYYKNRETKQIRQYEFENFEFQYKAYKALKGNSFIDKIHEEVLTWEIIS